MRNQNEVCTFDLIVNVAEELFRKKGYRATSMMEIAKAVGVEKAALYYHFPSKEALLDYILENERPANLKALEEIAASTLSVEERLCRLIRQHITNITNSPARATITYSILQFEHPELTDGLRDKIRLHNDSYEHVFRQVVSEGIEAGVIRSDNASLVTLMIFGACNWMSVWYRPDGPLHGTQIADHFTDYILGGILKNLSRSDEARSLLSVSPYELENSLS